MNELDLKINSRLMEEMGFEEGDRRRVIDQDSGIQYTIKGKDIVSPGNQGGKQSIEFDPVNNVRMMNYLFGEFVNKLEEEESIPPVSTYYTMLDERDSSRVKAKILMDDNKILESKPYRNETIAYADLVLQLNGEENVDLSEYDVDRRKIMATIKAPTSKKKGRTKNDSKKS